MNDRTEEDLSLDFSAFVAHEVYRLSEVIRITLERVDFQSPIESKNFDLVRHASNRLHYISEFALLSSKLRSGILSAHVIILNLESIFDSILPQLELLFRGDFKRVQFLKCEVGTFQADPVLLEFALINIIENALKYGKDEITVSAQTENDELHITVKNQRLDENSETLKSESPSWGIGHKLLLKIAELHGGAFLYSDDGNQVLSRLVIPNPE